MTSAVQPRRDSAVTLPDGRRLAYAEFGDRSGRPVMYFHGTPSCRLEPLLFGPDLLARLRVRLIAPDRPGIGGSDDQRNRSIVDWPKDVMELANALGADRFAVLGNSGGAPYAAACAARLPDRVRAAAIVSGGWRMDWPEARHGLPFVNRLVFMLARRAPALLRVLFNAMVDKRPLDRDKELTQLKQRVPDADYRAFAVPGRIEAFREVMRETMSRGAGGAVDDMQLVLRDFGFAPSEIRVPLLWYHGTADRNSPLALARRVVDSIPGAQLIVADGEAHLSTLTSHVEAALDRLVAV